MIALWLIIITAAVVVVVAAAAVQLCKQYQNSKTKTIELETKSPRSRTLDCHRDKERRFHTP